MAQNVLIPLPLLIQIIDLLGYWDLSNYDMTIQCQYSDVLRALNFKLQKLELRDTYANIVRADNNDDRDQARIRYLRHKHFLCADENRTC